MKTKQTNISRVIFATQQDNARNHGGDKETTSTYIIVDKKTEREVVRVRVYMGRSSKSSTVYASIWVDLSDKKKPMGWEWGHTSGTGSAGGYGYHKKSAAIASAIESAGIELYGRPYQGEKPEGNDRKNRVHFGGCGSSSIDAALLAIAYAAGYSDCLYIRA